MLAEDEDKCIVPGKPLTLRLGDVDVVSLCMGRGMASQEIVWWIVASMNDGESKSKRVWNISDRLHQASWTSIYFENSLTFISRK